MGKKTMATRDKPTKMDSEGSSHAVEPPVANPPPAAVSVVPTAVVPPQPAMIPAGIPPQIASQPTVPLSQVMEFLKVLNPGIDWGMAMGAMGAASQNPTVPTVPPITTVVTSEITSPTPITENPSQQEPPANRAVEPENPDTSAPKKTNVSPISVYEPASDTKERMDESEEEVKGEGERDEEGAHEEEKGKGIKETGSERKGMQSGEEGENEREEGKKDTEEVVDEALEKEKLMSAEEFEEMMEGVRFTGSSKDDSAAVDIWIERTENPDDVEGGNHSDGEADGGEGSEGEVVPQEKEEIEKESKSVNRRLVLEAEVETQAMRQGAKRFSRRIAGHGGMKKAETGTREETVEISSEEEEAETPLKKKARAIPTDQDEDNTAEAPKETTPVVAPESITPVAAENSPIPVVPEGNQHPNLKDRRNRPMKKQSRKMRYQRMDPRMRKTDTGARENEKGNNQPNQSSKPRRDLGQPIRTW